MLTDAVQGIAENNGPAEMRVKEWLHAKMITRAKQALTRPVPDGKGEVAEQVFDTLLTPRPVCSEEQFDICRPGLDLLAPDGQLSDQLVLCVYARISNNPNTPVQREGLVLTVGFFSGLEQRVTKADVVVHPDLLRVRTAEAHEVRHPAQKCTMNGSTVHIENAYDSAHGFTGMSRVLWGESRLSPGTTAYAKTQPHPCAVVPVQLRIAEAMYRKRPGRT